MSTGAPGWGEQVGSAGEPGDPWSRPGDEGEGTTAHRAPWHITEVVIVVIVACLSVRIVTGIVTGATATIGVPNFPGRLWRSIEVATLFADGFGVLFVGAALALLWWRVGRSVSVLDSLPDEDWEDDFYDTMFRLMRLRALCTALVVLAVITAAGALMGVVSDILYVHTTSSGAPVGDLISQYLSSGYGVVNAALAIGAAWVAWYLRDWCGDTLRDEGGDADEQDYDEVSESVFMGDEAHFSDAP